MKEIKFRAWDKKEQKMWWDILTDMGEHDNYDDEISMWSVAYAMNNGHDERFMFMQFTGLYDKNGKEIYEGDVVKIVPGEMNEINETRIEKVHQCLYACSTAPLSENTEESHVCCGWTSGKDMEIIGNIYENPELLRE